MKAIKTFTSLLLVLVIVFSFVTMNAGALASGTANSSFQDNSSFLQFARQAEEELLVFCASMENFPDISEFNATLSNQPVEIVSMDSAREEPVIYYCLVDVSGSVNFSQLIMAEEMLKSLCDSLGSEDKMLIDTFAQEHKKTDYMRDHEQIYREIEQISTTEEDTDLYRGIAESLQEFNTNIDLAGQRKCMVLFSDGIDDISPELGATKQEAEKMIDDSHIPVYCMIPPYGVQDDNKVLGSFSSRSPGGEAYYMANSDLTTLDIGKAITKDMKGDKILKLNLSGVRAKDDEMLLAVQYTNKYGTVYGDTLPISSNQLSVKTGSQAGGSTGGSGGGSTGIPVTAATPAPTFIASPISREEDNTALWIKIGLGVVCLIAVALIIWQTMKKKKEEQRRNQEEEEERERRAEVARMNKLASIANGSAADAAYQGGQNSFSTEAVGPATRGSGRGGRTIRFVSVGSQSFTKEISVQEGKQTTVGRNKKADVILNESDNRLSGVHFILLLKDNLLSVRDAGSTNGTTVNGVKVRDNPVTVRSGDTLSAGSYQYRVQY